MTRRARTPKARQPASGPSGPSRPRRRPSTRVIVIAAIIAAVLVVAAIAVVGVALTRGMYTLLAQPPAVGTVIVAPEQSKARGALAHLPMDADATAATDYLAAQPTAYWLTPEQDPLGVAGQSVVSLLAQARDADRAVAFVVYGLPDRDCGSHSAGGLSAEEYPRWVEEIGSALHTAPDVQKIIILEPDSIALATECGSDAARAGYLSHAIDALDSPATWIYIDGGHSSWHSADDMAQLIGRMGLIDRVRGVATNVSNYQSTFDEFAYAHALSERLGGIHAVVDTSRNGAATAGGAWCNPPGQRVGDAGGTFGDEVVDTNLWIKPPGESDGTCNGGPAAGVWWPQGAVTLTADTR